MKYLAKLLSPFFVSILFVSAFSLAGCAPAGQNQPAQNSSAGAVLGKILTDVATVAIETQADQAMGKNRGKIDRIQLLQKNNNGYLLLVSYSDVKLPQGVTIVAEAYGVEGKLAQYSSIPVPINQKQGQVQLALSLQGGWVQNSPKVTNIFVKMVRDNNQNSWIAASSYLPGGQFQSAAGQPASPPSTLPAPVPATTDQAFCSQYADTAAQQFHLAQQRNCPGIAFPVWHDNKMLHYNWCLGVSRQAVNNEMTRRNNHLKTCVSN